MYFFYFRGLPDNTKPELELIRANYTAKTGASGSPVILVKTKSVVGVHCEGEYAAKYAVSAQCVKAALRDWSGSEVKLSLHCYSGIYFLWSSLWLEKLIIFLYLTGKRLARANARKNCSKWMTMWEALL